MHSSTRIRRSELASSLATVAIAGISGGPPMAAGAALSRILAAVRAKVDATAELRELRRHVAELINHWAVSERLADEDVRIGLTTAVDAVATSGLTIEEIADLGFAADRAADAVISAARVGDGYWGSEPHYAVVERAIHTTYEALIGQYRTQEGLLLPVLVALRTSLEGMLTTAQAAMAEQNATLTEIATSVTSTATTADLIRYLQTRIADWDRSPWRHGAPPSVLERRLRVRTRQGEPTTTTMGTDDALHSAERMLVILGGPGSGKSWLARRYARHAAQTALTQLERGDDLTDIEIPIYTTWDQWPADGDVRQSLARAAVKSGIGNSDLGSRELVERLERTLTREGSRVLAVVDSLDEAADQTGQSGRLRELESLHGWRVVVTSRIAAWDATYTGADRARPDRPRPLVMQLEELDHDAVTAFIRAWFTAAPELGDRLIGQIREHEVLRRSAVVPLLLTFYCILAGDPEHAARGLPTSTQELYHSIVRRLLAGRWSPGSPGSDRRPDVAYCEQLLQRWAWDATGHGATANGLGRWGETFVPATMPERDARAIDHVAPKVAESDELDVRRRFLHRTVQEHLVAEFIAGLDAPKAVEVLLPHVWFDPDWKVAAPAAIVAHHRRRPGVLLGLLLGRAAHPEPDPARRLARVELDRLLLSAAAVAPAGAWSPARPELQTQRDRILAAWWDDLANGGFGGAGTSAGVRRAVEATATERARARRAVLESLASLGNLWEHLIVETLRVLVTADDRVAARTELLTALPTSPSWATGSLVTVLTGLEPTHAELRCARHGVLAALAGGDPWHAEGQVEALLTLVPTGADRRAARRAILSTLATLSDSDVFTCGFLIRLLQTLGVTPSERAEARAALVALIPTSHSWALEDMVAALLTLDPTAQDLDAAREALQDAPPAVDESDARSLAAALAVLDGTAPRPDDDAEAGEPGLAASAGTVAGDSPATQQQPAPVVEEPDSTVAERAHVRETILSQLRSEHPSSYALVRAWQATVRTEDDRVQARPALLAALAQITEPNVLRLLVPALRAVSTPQEWLDWLEAPLVGQEEWSVPTPS